MISPNNIDPKWYLLYSKPRSEKKAAHELEIRGHQVYLPLQRTLRQWSDRKKWVEEPLFKSYLFVFTTLERNFYDILNVPGIVKFVNFEKSPAIVDAREIDLVKRMLGNTSDMEVATDLLEVHSEEENVEVEIIAGPLIGTRGIILNRKGKTQLLVELTSMHQKILLHVPLANVRRVKPA